MSHRGSDLKRLLDKWAPAMAFTGGAVPTLSIVGGTAMHFLDDLEALEPDLRALSKRFAPNYSVAEVAIISRPLFNPAKFAVGIYAWPDHARYLGQDLILGSSADGSVIYHSGRWPGIPVQPTAWRDILELGKDAATTGDYGAFKVGDDWWLRDHRNTTPSSSQYDAHVWAAIVRARAFTKNP